MIRRVFLVLVFSAQTAVADVATQLEDAFRGWVAEVGADQAVMTIWQQDRHDRDVAVGMDAQTPVELASLSKAITGLCAAHLIETGVWDVQTTSFAVLGNGPTDLTVGALMTHSAGLGPDGTQVPMQVWLDTPRDRAEDAAKAAFARTAQTTTVGRYAYNNENYAVLAAMISAETGAPHTAFCKTYVLDPAGASTAHPSPRTKSMAGWGGWMMSVQDYARVMRWGYGPDGKVGATPQSWPQVDVGGGAVYGVGMTQRAFGGKMNYWHFGALCFPGQLNIGSYAVSWMDDWRAVVAYNRCLSWDDMIRLDRMLARAVFP